MEIWGAPSICIDDLFNYVLTKNEDCLVCKRRARIGVGRRLERRNEIRHTAALAMILHAEILLHDGHVDELAGFEERRAFVCRGREGFVVCAGTEGRFSW